MPDRFQQFWDGAALVSAQVVISLLLFAAVIAVIVFLVRGRMRKYKPADLAVFDRIKPWTNARTSRVMLFITLLGKHQFLIPANLILIVYFLLVSPHSWLSIRVAAIALSSLALMFLLKHLFRRKRPLPPLLQAARGLSFPSGHAIMAVTFYGLLMYIVAHTVPVGWLRWLSTVLLALLIVLIGFSRIYLRVHYASDVLAGFIIGLLWLFISLAVMQRVEQFLKERVQTTMPAAVITCSPVKAVN
ncbi:MAG: phosphatase PAP2 family protein [Chitinophagaceae bacterium]